MTSPEILNGYLNQLTRVSKLSDFQKKEKIFWRLKPIAEITNEQDYQLSKKIASLLEGYFLSIDIAVINEPFFRDSGFSINDFALKLGMPKSHLNFIFKYHAEISFSDFKKINRIKHAIKLIDDNFLKRNTFETLAKEVGFATYNTFYLSFKEVTGLSPQNYISSVEKAVPA
jgi:AraC-like DNA-binding protein